MEELVTGLQATLNEVFQTMLSKCGELIEVGWHWQGLARSFILRIGFGDGRKPHAGSERHDIQCGGSAKEKEECGFETGCARFDTKALTLYPKPDNVKPGF